MGVYSKDDLFTLWLNFRGQSNELQMMEDFGLCSKDEAQKLINEFETRMEVETLDGDHRGKEDRGAVEYGKPTKPTKPTKPKKATKAAPPNHKYQPFRDRFPELSALLDNGKPPTGGTPSTTLIDRKVAEKIIQNIVDAAEVQ